MNPKYKAELKKSACEAVEMNRKEPGAEEDRKGG